MLNSELTFELQARGGRIRELEEELRVVKAELQQEKEDVQKTHKKKTKQLMETGKQRYNALKRKYNTLQKTHNEMAKQLHKQGYYTEEEYRESIKETPPHHRGHQDHITTSDKHTHR